MDSKTRQEVALKVSKYLRKYSKARQFLLVDDVDKNLSKTFYSSNQTQVISDKSYLLYRCESEDKHSFISKEIDIKPKIYKRKHVPTFITQKSFYPSYGANEFESLIQKVRTEFYTLEDEFLCKLIQCSFLMSKTKEKDSLKEKSLKDAIMTANYILKYRVKLIDALTSSNDLLVNRVTPKLKFNILHNVAIHNTDIKDSLIQETNNVIYKDNTLYNSINIKPNCLYVVPTPEHLGVMPIVNDIELLLDKHCIISFYEIGMSILNTNNIIKIELEEGAS